MFTKNEKTVFLDIIGFLEGQLGHDVGRLQEKRDLIMWENDS